VSFFHEPKNEMLLYINSDSHDYGTKQMKFNTFNRDKWELTNELIVDWT
jgi:hypothetical protein